MATGKPKRVPEAMHGRHELDSSVTHAQRHQN
jgi:hypothetical protein